MVDHPLKVVDFEYSYIDPYANQRNWWGFLYFKNILTTANNGCYEILYDDRHAHPQIHFNVEYWGHHEIDLHFQTVEIDIQTMIQCINRNIRLSQKIDKNLWQVKSIVGYSDDLSGDGICFLNPQKKQLCLKQNQFYKHLEPSETTNPKKHNPKSVLFQNISGIDSALRIHVMMINPEKKRTQGQIVIYRKE